MDDMYSPKYWRMIDKPKMSGDIDTIEGIDDAIESIDDAIESTVKLDITCSDLETIIGVIMNSYEADLSGYSDIGELSADIWLGLTESGVSVENALLSVKAFKKARQEKNY